MTVIAILILLAWGYLATLHGAFWRPCFAPSSPEPKTWPSVDIIVPARNEADILPQCLPTLLKQNYAGAWRIILVDDHSTDGTEAVANDLAEAAGKLDRLMVVKAPDLPEGWVGKVAAMQAGVAQSNADYILFTDADIFHPSHSLRRITARALYKKLDLVSLMVKLHCEMAAEKLLIPAFVFFFSLLYPFRRVNNSASKVVAAAGGVMLVRRAALDNAGGLAAIKSAVIDDCSLAKIIKGKGNELSRSGSIELTLSSDTRSVRIYPQIQDIRMMISRSAFTQLEYSSQMLSAAIFGMTMLFVMPLLFLLFGNLFVAAIGLMCWLVMGALYLPMLRYYHLPVFWALTLPFAAIIYIEATIHSARQYWAGLGGQWKGRHAAKVST